jgi:hypothetical protein
MALQDAIDALPTERFHAVVVDEGRTRPRLARDARLPARLPGEDTLWVFHDQAGPYRDDVVSELGLERSAHENWRNPSRSRAAGRFTGSEEVSAFREGRHHHRDQPAGATRRSRTGRRSTS